MGCKQAQRERCFTILIPLMCLGMFLRFSGQDCCYDAALKLQTTGWLSLPEAATGARKASQLEAFATGPAVSMLQCPQCCSHHGLYLVVLDTTAV